MKRYWLFGGSKFYPSGGFEDFIDSFDSLTEACAAPSLYEFSSIEYPDCFDHLEWWQVFDSLQCKIVGFGGDWFGGDDPVNLKVKPVLRIKDANRN